MPSVLAAIKLPMQVCSNLLFPSRILEASVETQIIKLLLDGCYLLDNTEVEALFSSTTSSKKAFPCQASTRWLPTRAEGAESLSPLQSRAFRVVVDVQHEMVLQFLARGLCRKL